MMEMFTALSLFGLGIGFAVLVFFGLLAALVENERPFSAALMVAAALVILQAFTPYAPLTAIYTNPISVLAVIAIYVMSGVAYGAFRWWRFLYATATTYREKRAEYIKRYSKGVDLGNLSDEARADFITAMNNKLATQILGGYKRLMPSPLISEHKNRVITWMIYWPFSGFFMLFNDLLLNFGKTLMRFWNFVYSQFAGSFQSMSDRIFSKYQDDGK
jgi:hypothetical protein